MRTPAAAGQSWAQGVVNGRPNVNYTAHLVDSSLAIAEVHYCVRQGGPASRKGLLTI